MLAGVGLRRRPGARSLYQVVVMGLGTMALEILVLVLYQIRLGSLYQQLGMLIAAFMAGMAAGSAAGSRWTGRVRGGPRLLAGLQGGLAVLAVSLALWLQGGDQSAASWSEFWTRAGYLLVLAAAGFGGGGIFALSAALWHEIQPEVRGQGGMLYAADLLGATLGTLGVSLLVLPVWGIVAGPLAGGVSPCRGRGDGAPDPAVLDGRRPPPPRRSISRSPIKTLQEGFQGGPGVLWLFLRGHAPFAKKTGDFTGIRLLSRLGLHS